MIRGVYALSGVLTAAGMAGAAVVGGKDAAAGFLIGAGYSLLSYRFFDGVVGSLGTSSPRRVSAFLLAIRYLLLGGMLYVILKLLPTGLTGALSGLFVCLVAVVILSIREHYARTS